MFDILNYYNALYVLCVLILISTTNYNIASLARVSYPDARVYVTLWSRG